MKKKEMIERIYEVIANKTLSLGCFVKDTRSWLQGKYIRSGSNDDKSWHDVLIGSDTIRFADIVVIWHPVMIGDTLEYLAKTMPRTYSWECSIYCDVVMKTIGIWSKKTKPIEDQSIECIEYIYSLINQ
jgi:hypothetical protein